MGNKRTPRVQLLQNPPTYEISPYRWAGGCGRAARGHRDMGSPTSVWVHEGVLTRIHKPSPSLFPLLHTNACAPTNTPPPRVPRDDDEPTPDRAGKPIPDWARSHNLGDCLRRQQHMDPDKIFAARQTTCPLDDIFLGVGARWHGWGGVLKVALSPNAVPARMPTFAQPVKGPQLGVTHHDATRGAQHAALTLSTTHTHTHTLLAAELLPNAQPSRPRKRELHQRTSSGDWSRDKVTWSEEIQYKKAMGFV